jgi:hypothetical protein
MKRAIVIHGAEYVSEEFISKYGRLGRSWGCPALPKDLTKSVIDEIKEGKCLFAYSADTSYLKKSCLLEIKNLTNFLVDESIQTTQPDSIE